MKRMAILMASLMPCLTTIAQNGTVSGKLKDSLSGKPLSLATITIFKASDTTIVTYRLSNAEGDFKIPGLPLDIPLRVLVTFSGYHPYREVFSLNNTNPLHNLGTVQLAQTAKELDEVIVIAERPPVSVKHDTIEFNATAFKTLPNALVEDLLKKLPGVFVDGDGNISVNGKTVNRILVDGKTFFGNDPKMATRNLPANVIDKVQVMNDQEELLRNGDDNINNVGKVLNITLKKEIKKGWFGKVYGGAGENKRYETGGIANIFRDTVQLSILGYSNNLNRPGFSLSDLGSAGGFDRSNSNLTSRTNGIHANNSGTGILINGISFGGLQTSGGVATSSGAGFNFNHAPNLKRSFFVQYFYGNSLVNRLNQSDSKLQNADTVIENRSRLDGTILTNAHNIGIGGKLKPDSVTTIQASASYTASRQADNRFSNISSTHSVYDLLSQGTINQVNRSGIFYYRHALTITRLSKTRKGRRYTVFHSLDVNNRFNKYTTVSATHILFPSAADSLLNQLRNEGVPRVDAVGSFNYSEPLSPKFTLRTGGRYEYGKLDNAVTTFNPGSVDGVYDKISPFLSNRFHRESNRFFVNAGLEYRVGNLTVTPGARYLAQGVDNMLGSLPSPIKQQTSNVLPSFSLVYKRLNINYNKDIVLPGYIYLIPVSDNSNPYYISNGNAALQPAQRNTFSFSWFGNDPKKNTSAGINTNIGFSKGDVVNSTIVDSKGVQTVTPVNADGGMNAGISYQLTRQYRTGRGFIGAFTGGGSYSYVKSRFIYNGESSWQHFFDLEQFAIINLNFNDRFECNSSAEFQYDATRYSNHLFSNLHVTSYQLTNELVLRYPKHIIWETHYNYAYNGSSQARFSAGMNWMSAAVNITMLRDEKGVLKISITNLFNNNANVNTSVYRNVVTTSQTNVLGRYLMATFTYNIRKIGATRGKIGQSLFRF